MSAPSLFSQTNTWQGGHATFTYSWSEPTNWSLGIVPTSAHDVVIPNGDYYCYVSGTGGYSAYCNSLELQSGQSLRVGNGTINVTGDMDIYGYCYYTWSTAAIDVGGDLTWHSGSTESISQGSINVGGDWYFNNNTSATLSGTNMVTFDGTSSQFIYCMDNNAQFNDVTVDQTGSSALWLGTSSTEDIHIAGDLTILNLNLVQVQSEALLVDGTVDVQSGGKLYLEHAGGTMTTNSDLGLDGQMNINGGDVVVNADFDLQATGILNLSNGSFSEDASVTVTNFYGGLNLSGTGLLTINGSVDINSTADITISGGTFQVEYDFDVNGTNTFQPSGGTVEMIGTPVSGIDCYKADGNYFYNLVINKSSYNDAYITGDTEVKNDFTINDGTFRLTAGMSSYDLEVGGDWINNMGAANFEEGTGTVIFDGTSQTQITADETFYNLTFNKLSSSYNAVDLANGITITVLSDLDINNGCIEMNSNSTIDVDSILTIASGAGLNATGDDNLNIYVGLIWDNQNTSYSTNYGFNPGVSSTVTFDGLNFGQIGSSATYEEFYNLHANVTTSWVNVVTGLKVMGDLTVDGGGMKSNGGYDHIFEGDITVNSGYFDFQTNLPTVNLTGTADQTLYGHDWTHVLFFDLLVDKSGASRSQSVFMTGDGFQVLGDLTIDEGTVNLGGTLHDIGNIIVNDGGILTSSPGTWIDVTDVTVNNNGVLELVGTSGNEIDFRISSDCHIESGGQIGAEYVEFKELQGSGINVKNGGLVSATYPFDNCSFEGLGTGTLLTIDNNQTLTIDGAHFPQNTWSGTSNIKKTMDHGSVNFTNATGLYAGPVYEDDTHGRIHWDGDTPGLWTGIVSTDWDNILNWHFSLKPTSSDNAVIPTGTPFSPSVHVTNGECYDLEVQSGATLTINSNSLDVGNDVEIYGQLVMNHASGVLTVGHDFFWKAGSSDNIVDGQINLSGDWWFENGTNSQLAGTNTVTLNGSANQLIYCYDDDACFNHLIIGQSEVSATFCHTASTQPIRIDGNLTIENSNIFQVETTTVVVDGILTVQNGGELYLEDIGGTLTNHSNMVLPGEICVNGGDMTIHGTFDIQSTGILTIISGSFESDAGTGTNTIDGAFNISGGTYTSLESIYIGATGNIDQSGGVISTQTGFIATNAGTFEPTGGTVEFKDDVSGLGVITCTNGNYFHNIRVDNSSTGGASLGSDIEVQNDVEISDGNLWINEYTLDVDGDILVYDKIHMVDVFGEIVVGNAIHWYSGSDDGITHGLIKVFGDWYFHSGTLCDLSIPSSTNTVIFEGTSNSFISSNESNAAFNDVLVNLSTPANDILTISGTQQLNIKGTLTLDDGTIDQHCDVKVW
jgi:hypothetical protein